MTDSKPSQELLRGLTDEHVLRAFMSETQLTRAEVATRTQLSKPTISESVRRLAEAGLLRDTGDRTTGRGAVGSYYALADDIGCALVVSIGVDGIIAETVDAQGRLGASCVRTVERTATSSAVTRTLKSVCREAIAKAVAPPRLAVVSAADPVDRTTGRLVELPDAAFLVGDLAPVEALTKLVDGPIQVDNDVNWAARAEYDAAITPPDDFAYIYLGEGLGCAIVSDGKVRRGHGGIAGEISHVTATGPNKRAMPFTSVFEALGLHHPNSTAIDVTAILDATAGDSISASRMRAAIAAAFGDVLAAVISLTDPELVIIGGPWGSAPHIFDAIAETFARAVRHAPLQAASVLDDAPLQGARNFAIEALRASIIASRQPASP